jgi:polysaccharide chain length determinant protein (PEP-CTERM system associated)
VDQPQENSQGLDLYWNIAKRRRWWILVPFVVGWATVLAASWFIPPRYRSESLILVEQQSVPSQYVMPNVTMDVSARMNALTEQIMSRTRLLAIADKFNLYGGTKGKADPDQVTEKLRKDISIDLQSSKTNRGDQLTAFKLSYVSSSAQLAQQVTNELTSLFIDTSMKHSAEASQQTTEFLQHQLELARKDLDEQETKLRDFKSQNLGELPEQLQSNVQILTGLQGRLQAATDTMNRAEQQRVYLESLLAQYRGAARQTASADAPVSPAALDQRLALLHQQLTELQAKYTDKHPDVIRLKGEIAAAEAMKSRIEKDQKGQAETPNRKLSPSELQAQAPLMQIESSLKANASEIASDRAEIKNINNQIGQYQGRLNLTPMREQQLAGIIRDHEQSQKNYDELLKKSQQSELATSLENRQQGEQFKLIDPPSLPLRPYFPDRSKMALIGLGVGLALGVAVAGAMEFSDMHVYTEGQVKEIVGATMMIVGVPSLWTASEVHVNRRSTWMQTGVAVMLLLAVSSVTVYTLLHG